jgi:hypothetical protein
MMRPRPGVALSDDERFAALLGDVIYRLEQYQAPQPNNDIEASIETLRFVRRQIQRRFDPRTGARR